MTSTPVAAPVDSDVARPGTTKTNRVKKRLTSRGATVVSLIIAVLWTLPTFGLFISSFRPEEEIKGNGWWTIFANPGFTLDNYKDVLFSSSSSSPQLGEYFVNSLAIAIPATIFPLVLAAMAAYAFAWIKFKWSGALFVFIFALQIVPLQLALIPLLQIFSGVLQPFQESVGDALNIPTSNYLQIWIAHTIFALPLAIFLLHNYMASLPKEILEAARIDGADHPTIFWRLVLPLSVPALAAFGIFQFLWVWNDYLVALTFVGGAPDAAPMTIRLASLSGGRGQDWHLLTAAAFVSIALPVAVFFALQRYFVRGLLAGSVKG